MRYVISIAVSILFFFGCEGFDTPPRSFGAELKPYIGDWVDSSGTRFLSIGVAELSYEVGHASVAQFTVYWVLTHEKKGSSDRLGVYTKNDSLADVVGEFKPAFYITLTLFDDNTIEVMFSGSPGAVYSRNTTNS